MDIKKIVVYILIPLFIFSPACISIIIKHFVLAKHVCMESMCLFWIAMVFYVTGLLYGILAYDVLKRNHDFN